ncbi:hypothetical protein [Nakamurella lactea]|uniref:hypothetical protein n=1 Tax=Nakamurella lactea TaxID=459515 RepID=UPI0003F8FF0D|nr:hypothetical protein [Nakamurella lactea]
MTTVQEAFIAVVKAAVPAGVKVFDSIVTGNTTAQYVAVYPDNGDRTQGAAQGFNDGKFRFQITSVASGSVQLGQELRGLRKRVSDALIGVRLVADGWLCGPVESDFSNKPLADESALPTPTVYGTDGFVLLADRLT